MSSILKACNLTKKYGKKKALDNLTFDLQEGRIIGIFGPNGGGKTTLLKIAAGLLKPSDGEIKIDSNYPGVYTKSIVSYLPDEEFLDGWMKIKDALKLWEDLFKDFNKAKSIELLEFMKLDINVRIKSLSKGMKEKLYVAIALPRDAKLYLLDEPLSGVDPITRENIISAILGNYSENKSIIITSHLVNAVEKIIDDVVFINNGKIILSGSADDLRAEKGLSIDEIYREVFANAEACEV